MEYVIVTHLDDIQKAQMPKVIQILRPISPISYFVHLE